MLSGYFGPKIADTIIAMYRSRFIITAFLIATWLLTPDVLCLLPGAELTMDEHECCERMGEQCGMIPMPDLHSCCQTVKRSEAVIASKVVGYSELRAATIPFIVPNLGIPATVENSQHWFRFESPTIPPLLSRDSYAILRI